MAAGTGREGAQGVQGAGGQRRGHMGAPLGGNELALRSRWHAGALKVLCSGA